jgi:hypothetical protein
MKKLLIMTGLAILAISIIAYCTVPVDESASAEVIELQGNVDVTRMQNVGEGDGQAQEGTEEQITLSTGDQVIQNDILSLAPDASVALELGDGIVAKISQGAQIGLDRLFGDENVAEIKLLAPGGAFVLTSQSGGVDDAELKVIYMRARVEVVDLNTVFFMEPKSRGQSNIYVKEGKIKLYYTEPGPDAEEKSYEIQGPKAVEITRGAGVDIQDSFDWVQAIVW